MRVIGCFTIVTVLNVFGKRCPIKVALASVANIVKVNPVILVCVGPPPIDQCRMCRPGTFGNIDESPPGPPSFVLGSIKTLVELFDKRFIRIRKGFGSLVMP